MCKGKFILLPDSFCFLGLGPLILAAVIGRLFIWKLLNCTCHLERAPAIIRAAINNLIVF